MDPWALALRAPDAEGVPIDVTLVEDVDVSREVIDADADNEAFADMETVTGALSLTVFTPVNVTLGGSDIVAVAVELRLGVSLATADRLSHKDEEAVAL